MSKIKLLLSIITVCLVTSLIAYAKTFDITIPVKGKTIASEQLQKDSLFTIYSFALRVASPTCENYSITDTKVSKAKANGEWEEIWTIKACEKTALVPVKFTDKGTYYVNPMGVKYGK